MKAKFLANYPSELLNQDTTPSTRLLSLVHHQLSKKQWQWVPWKYRLSQSKVEDLQTQRAAKMPKLESLTLGALMIDDVPSLEIRNEGMGLHAVRTLMDIHNVALAMCGAAHLAALKEYSQKFLSLLTQKVDPELGLRNANIIESQSADRQCWYVMAELINERQWTMNDALHEITHIRHDLSTLLQLRPRPPKAITTWSSSTSSSLSKGSKGKGKSSGKSKSSNVSKGKNAWITEIKLPDGSRKQLCINFQSGRCHRADCKFAHYCAYPTSDGTACGKAHSAQQHQTVSHWHIEPTPIVVQDDGHQLSSSSSLPGTHFGQDVSPQIQRETSTSGILDGLSFSDPIIIDDPEEVHYSGILPSDIDTSDMVQNPSQPVEVPSDSNDPSSSSPTLGPAHLKSPAIRSLSAAIHNYRIFLDICAGVTRPLSQALLAHHCDVISFDILLHDHMDLLADDSYEALLKLSASGAVSYGAASPACAQYSRLKLRADAGPKALRTPEHLQGVPGLTPQELAKVQTSYIMLSRCLTCLSLIHAAGGHVHVEQPPSAMSWLEPETQQFVKSIGIHCINLAACQYGKDWHKSWMFASSFGDLRKLAGTCPHPYGSHQTILGKFNQAGDFLSNETACYPLALAQAFAASVAPLFSTHVGDISWDQRICVIPVKAPDAFPRSQEDGGGLYSQPDWSQSGRIASDSFAELRKSWMNRIISQRLDKKLVAFCQLESPNPPFSEEELIPFRQDLVNYLVSNSQTPDWQVRAHQPMHLNILKSLSLIMQDEDQTLFDSLINGVTTGFHNDIPPSKCFPPNDRPSDPSTMDSLSAHFSNWQSVMDHPELTQELVQEEIEKGWVFEYEGTLADAQAEFPGGVALGKLGIATSEGRPPRLVVDQSVCVVTKVYAAWTNDVRSPNGPHCHQPRISSVHIQSEAHPLTC